MLRFFVGLAVLGASFGASSALLGCSSALDTESSTDDLVTEAPSDGGAEAATDAGPLPSGSDAGDGGDGGSCPAIAPCDIRTGTGCAEGEQCVAEEFGPTPPFGSVPAMGLLRLRCVPAAEARCDPKEVSWASGNLCSPTCRTDNDCRNSTMGRRCKYYFDSCHDGAPIRQCASGASASPH